MLRVSWSVFVCLSVIVFSLISCSSADLKNPLTYSGDELGHSYSVGEPISPITPIASLALENFQISPALPAGLHIDRATGVISGTPTQAARSDSYVISAANNGEIVTAVVRLEVNEVENEFAVAATSLRNEISYRLGQEVSYQSSLGGTNFTVSPDLPMGLELDSATGVITGVPAEIRPLQTYTIRSGNDSQEYSFRVVGTPSVDGKIVGMAYSEADDVLYLGGAFSSFQTHTGSGLILLGGTTSQPNGIRWPVFNGPVNCVVRDPSTGGFFVGGFFSKVGNLDRRSIVKLKADGSVDPDFAPVLHQGQLSNGGYRTARVNALLVDNGNIYVGGDFTLVGETSRTGLVRLNAQNGALDSWGAEVDARVHALAKRDQQLFVGGYFRKVRTGAGQPWIDRKHLVLFNVGPGTERLEDWNPNPNSVIYAMTNLGSYLFVGGGFRDIAGQSRSNLASFDINSRQLRDWNPSPNSTVRAMHVWRNNLFVGGSFNQLSPSGGTTVTRRGIALVGTYHDNVYGFNANLSSGIVFSIAPLGSRLYIGGNVVLGNERRRILELNINTGQATDWTFGVDNQVLALASSGSHLFVGGQFNAMAGARRKRLAAIRASTGEILDWNPGANGEVEVLYMHGDTLFIGGEFTEVAGQSRSRLASFDLESGGLTNWSPHLGLGSRHTYDKMVSAIVSDGQRVFVGGSFVGVEGDIARKYFAAYDQNGQEMGWDPEFRHIALRYRTYNCTSYGQDPEKGDVSSLMIRGNTLFVGGRFSTVGEVDRKRIAAFNLDDLSLRGWAPNVEDSRMCGSGKYARVMALKAVGDTLYIGGLFTGVNGQDRANVAALDISELSAEAGQGVLPWNPSVLPVGSYDFPEVNAILLHGERLYLGGDIKEVGGESARHLVAVAANPEVASPEQQIFDDGSYISRQNFQVFDMLIANNSLFFVGGHPYSSARFALNILSLETELFTYGYSVAHGGY